MERKAKPSLPNHRYSSKKPNVYQNKSCKPSIKRLAQVVFMHCMDVSVCVGGEGGGAELAQKDWHRWGSLLPDLPCIDPPINPPPMPAEIVQHMWLQSHLQTFPPPIKLISKFQNPRTILIPISFIDWILTLQNFKTL